MSATTEKAVETISVTLDKSLVDDVRERAREHNRTLDEQLAADLRYQRMTSALRAAQKAFAGVAEEMGWRSEEDVFRDVS